MIMTAIWTHYRTRLIIAALIAMTIVIVPRHPTPAEVPTIDVTLSDDEPRDQTTANIEAPPADHNTSTITEVKFGWGCGTFVGVTEIRYGNDFGVVIPCIEFYQSESLRFVPGETQTVLVDDRDRVIAIRSRGATERFDGGFESVRTPAAAIGHLTWTIDSHMAYETDGSVPHWSWMWR
jgi:hypothetical protein